MGNAGLARLKLSLHDRNIPLCLETEFLDLITKENRVMGIKARKDKETVYIKANRGVVLASGGFEKNQEMRDKYLPNPSKQEWSAANLYNTGDAISASIKIGAQVQQMDSAWWSTVMIVPGEKKALSLIHI